jgi:hypothetical protein
MDGNLARPGLYAQRFTLSSQCSLCWPDVSFSCRETKSKLLGFAARFFLSIRLYVFFLLCRRDSSTHCVHFVALARQEGSGAASRLISAAGAECEVILLGSILFVGITTSCH